jgi:cystathionine beta-lyase/cystathionine gamma-synthase
MLAPFDSYLLSRGIKTLPVRMRQHEENALELTEYLESHDAVDRVFYPGLESHPQHDLASEQMSGYGGVFSFELRGGMAEARQFVESLETMNLAVSLGGVETLVNHPATMTHEPLGADRRKELGISDSLIRVSVGIEDVDDLITDFEQAVASVEAATPSQ